MLTEEEYFKFIITQQKMLTDEIKEAIKEQTRLSKIAHEMQDIRDALEERSKNLIILGFAKLKEKYPDIESKLSQKETTVEAMKWMLNEFINNNLNSEAEVAECNLLHGFKTAMRLMKECL